MKLENFIDLPAIEAEVREKIEINPELAKELIIQFIELLIKIVPNDKIDDVLLKIEGFIKEEDFGLLKILINAIKIKREI